MKKAIKSTETPAATLLRAALFATQKHSEQRRKDEKASPYINHPIHVAHLLATVGGVDDLDTLVAALLHDTIEDTDTTAAELASEFGERVAELVEEMSDDKSLPREERKRLQIEHAGEASGEAKRLKIADKIANVRDVAENPAQGWSIERRRGYVEWAAKVVDECRGVSPPLEARFDEALANARSALDAAEG